MARRWLITGASRGIGAAIAAVAVGRGDSALLVARGDAVRSVADELGAHAAQVDLSAPDGAGQPFSYLTSRLVPPTPAW